MSSTQSREDIVSRFAAQVSSIGGRVTSVRDLMGLREYVGKLAVDSNARLIVAFGRRLVQELGSLEASMESLKIASRIEMPREEFFAAVKIAEIGVSPADLAVAETGTVVVATSDELDRLVTALPRVHVAVLQPSKIVSSLADAEPPLARFLEGDSHGVAVSLISGPSKTGDIGGMLVVGVHGPSEFHVCLLDQELCGDS